MQAQRGSVARSTCGWYAPRIPSATYSRAAIVANSSTSAASRVAASPRVPGHCDSVRPSR